MTANEIINPEIYNTTCIAELHERFCANKPIRHLVIDNFLQADFAQAIFNHFPSIEEMNTHYKGINEKKAEHSDFTKLHSTFEELHSYLSTGKFINWLTDVTGVSSLETINDRLGYGLHQGANNSFLDIHIDYNLHPIKKLYRKLNFILFFNPRWEADWGGNLELWDKDVKNCIQSIAPIFNRCVIFECSNISYHGYDRINVPNDITRKSYYQYFFLPAPDSVSFHDTIFKPRPKENLTKKLSTYSKDFVKNMAKKVLFKLGWERFLK